MAKARGHPSTNLADPRNWDVLDPGGYEGPGGGQEEEQEEQAGHHHDLVRKAYDEAVKVRCLAWLAWLAWVKCPACAPS